MAMTSPTVVALRLSAPANPLQMGGLGSPAPLHLLGNRRPGALTDTPTCPV